MSNMSYCRFQNTLSDLRNCEENMDNSLSSDEFKARTELIELCKDIAQNHGNKQYEEGDDED